MTTIGTSLPNVPLSRDLNGPLDQPGTSGEASMESEGKSGSFATFLANLSQSPENKAAASPVSDDTAASESFKALAAAESSTANASEATAGQGTEPPKLAASLLRVINPAGRTVRSWRPEFSER